MDLQLNGKRALITGSTAGIGYAIAERLAIEGAQVVVNGRTKRRVDDALKTLSDQASSPRAWRLTLGLPPESKKLSAGFRTWIFWLTI